METNAEMKKRVMNPLYGIVWFAIFMVSYYFVGSFIQSRLGMLGLAISELIILAMGIIPALILGLKLRDVFPIKNPGILKPIGVILLWLSSYVFAMVGTYLVTAIKPEGMLEVSTGMSNMFSTVPFLVRFFIVAIMPAICEESLHRGFIQYTFKDIKVNRKLITILSMGIIFGVFHMDGYRFIATGVLGAMLAYIMYETKNILLPMFLHFLNNAFSVVVSELLTVFNKFMPATTAESVNSVVLTSEMCLFYAGFIMTLGCVAPLIFVAGAYLIKDNKNYNVKKQLAVAGIVAGVMLAIGIVLLAFNAKVFMNFAAMAV